MKTFLYIVIFLLIDFQLFANGLPYYFLNDREVFDKQNYRMHKKEHFDHIQKEFIPISKRNFDVLRYDLFMDWNDLLANGKKDGMNHYTGKNIIKFVVTQDSVGELVFDFNSQVGNIDKIFFAGELFQNFEHMSDKITLQFDTPLNILDTFNVEISYSFESGENDGLIFTEKGTPVDIGPPPQRDTVFTEENIAYTMSEPIDARKWMPCNDNPYDKALSSISIKVPKGYIAVSNGILRSVDSTENSHIYNWVSDYPITTYLMSVHASKFSYSYEWYKRVSNPEDSIKMEYYVWEKDFQDTTTDGRSYNSNYAFRNTVEMMEFYSTVFGEYPFDKYGQVAVQPTWFGGMEHQTITTLNRSVLRVYDRWGNNRDYSNQSVIAHELAHQWIGDYVTCASWNDIWINEGGAVWSEALWDGRNNENYYYSNIRSEMFSFFWYDNNQYQPPIYGPSINNVFNYATTYAKAGIFYHMLSEALGRERFLSDIRDILQHFAYQSITTEDFKNYLKEFYAENSPIDFDKFFEQWIYKAGYPIFNVEVASHYLSHNDKYQVDLSLTQTQNGIDVEKVYELPLWLKFFGPDGQIIDDSIYTKDRSEIHSFTLPFIPDSVAFDTLKVLMKVDDIVMSVKQLNEPVTEISSVYPNPLLSNQIGKIKLQLQENTKIKVEIYNELGSLIKNSYNGYTGTGSFEFDFSTIGLSSGNYFLKITNGGNVLFRKFTVFK